MSGVVVPPVARNATNDISPRIAAEKWKRMSRRGVSFKKDLAAERCMAGCHSHCGFRDVPKPVPLARGRRAVNRCVLAKQVLRRLRCCGSAGVRRRKRKWNLTNQHRHTAASDLQEKTLWVEITPSNLLQVTIDEPAFSPHTTSTNDVVLNKSLCVNVKQCSCK